MSDVGNISILGVGHCLGAIERGNDDPIFQWIREHPVANQDIFAGLTYRRALGPGETVTSIMATAARNALAAASLAPGDVDMLIGGASLSPYNAPNALSEVHRELALSGSCRVMALNTEYTTFLDGMKLANDLIRCGTIRHALVACGMNWTQHMDYTQAVCVAASDAAGAAVVGRSSDPSRFHLVDWDNETDTSYYGALRMAPDPVMIGGTSLFTPAVMTLDAATGRKAVLNFGVPVPPRVVARLLARHQLSAADITLVPHQVARMIETDWIKAIQPALYVSTESQLADMVSASVPVNLSLNYARIVTDHLVLLGIGMDMHVTVLLYARGSGTN